MDGNNLNLTSHLHHKKLTAQIRYFRAVFFSFLIFLLVTGCAKKLAPPPAKILLKKSPIIRVALDDNLKTATLKFIGKFRLVSEEADYILDQSLGSFQVSYSNSVLMLKSEKRSLSYKNFDQLRLFPEKMGYFFWNQIPYSGTITFVKNSTSVIAINTVPMPEYLMGVVPHEIPTHNDEYYQAVKAQTIAARTYAFYHIKNPASQYFDIYDDTRDQVYRGTSKKSEAAEKAVKETFGTALINSSGELVETQYHSTCGGILDVRSDYQDSSNAIEDTSGNTFNCATSPLYRWVKKITIREIIQNLRKYNRISAAEYQDLIDGGYQMDINIKTRHVSGRVESLEIQLNQKKIKLNQGGIRSIFATQNNNYLPSTLFFFKKSQNNPELMYIVGAGFGHGKGMCQWGAIGQALNGKSYQEILKFYYPSLTLKKMY